MVRSKQEIPTWLSLENRIWHNRNHSFRKQDLDRNYSIGWMDGSIRPMEYIPPLLHQDISPLDGWMDWTNGLGHHKERMGQFCTASLVHLYSELNFH